MNKQAKGNKKHLADILLIAVLLIVAAVLYFAFNTNQSNGEWVLVCADGDEIARYYLSEDGEYELNGGTNILVIKDGSASLVDADCPDKLCVKQGRIQYTGQCITCLPNRLTVTVYDAEIVTELVS